jgi:hypothetical protein
MKDWLAGAADREGGGKRETIKGNIFNYLEVIC